LDHRTPGELTAKVMIVSKIAISAPPFDEPPDLPQDNKIADEFQHSRDPVIT
jgi:hypothetical protein